MEPGAKGMNNYECDDCRRSTSGHCPKHPWTSAPAAAEWAPIPDSPVSKRLYCRNCNWTFNAHIFFCPYCGTKLTCGNHAMGGGQ